MASQTRGGNLTLIRNQGEKFQTSFRVPCRFDGTFNSYSERKEYKFVNVPFLQDAIEQTGLEPRAGTVVSNIAAEVCHTDSFTLVEIFMV